jgi:hypothetical protein
VDELARLKKEQEAEREEVSAARRREGALRVRTRKISQYWDVSPDQFWFLAKWALDLNWAMQRSGKVRGKNRKHCSGERGYLHSVCN